MRIVIDPIYWSTGMILAQGTDVICELARKSAATETAYRLVLGRCLLAMEQNKISHQLGYSGPVHYAVQSLGLSTKEAQTVLRVARALEALPRLSEAANRGEISWSKVREISSKATLETEATWLKLAAVKDANEIERLVGCTEYGGLPWDQPEESAPKTRLRLQLSAETGELMERAISSLSRKAGKSVSAAEALETLLIEFFRRRPAEGKVADSARADTRRGAAAAKMRHARMLAEARAIAEEDSLDDEPVCPLSIALGLAIPVNLSSSPPPSEQSSAAQGESSKVPSTGDQREPSNVQSTGDRSESSKVQSGQSQGGPQSQQSGESRRARPGEPNGQRQTENPQSPRPSWDADSDFAGPSGLGDSGSFRPNWDAATSLPRSGGDQSSESPRPSWDEDSDFSRPSWDERSESRQQANFEDPTDSRATSSFPSSEEQPPFASGAEHAPAHRRHTWAPRC